MVLIWFTLALATLTGFYFLMKRRHGEKPEYVELAPEGELETVNKSSLRFEPMSNQLIQTENGEVLDPSRYSAYTVRGDSMLPANIHDGDTIFVENMVLDRNSSPTIALEPNNIVVLYVEDFKRCKIRKIDVMKKDKINAYYYKNGNKVPSSRPYSVSQVKGVVRYVIPRKTPRKG